MQSSRDRIRDVGLVKLFIACPILLVLGSFFVFIVSPSGDQTRQYRELVASGRPGVALVSQQTSVKGRSGTLYHLTYVYTVGGQPYTGETDTYADRSKYENSTSVIPLNIVYLPNQPSVSSDDPQGWLDKNGTSSVVGWWLIGIGTAGLIGFGFVAKRTGFFPTQA